MKDKLSDLVFTVPPLGRVPVRVLLADQHRINVVLTKMVRGLFWMHTGNLLAPSTPFAAAGFNLLELAEALRDPNFVRFVQTLPMGLYVDDDTQRIFFYRGGTRGASDSAWVFSFYRSNVFVVGTGTAATEAGAENFDTAT